MTSLARTLAATATPGFSLKGLLARLIAADQGYRSRATMRALSDEHLKDMGLVRMADGTISRS